MFSESLDLLSTMFLTGVTSGLSHCVGMCGPIAISQLNIRLLNKEHMTGMQKIRCSFAVSYYIGKAITYSILCGTTFFLATYLNFIFLKYCAFIIMVFTAFSFIQSGTSYFFKSFDFRQLKDFFSFSTTRLLHYVSAIQSKQNKKSQHNEYKSALNQWLTGLMLGLIPCGLVYSIIVLIIARSDNIWIAIFSMFIFGIGTIPALFIVSYIGQHTFLKWRKFFDMLYTVSMFFNAWLLLNYAFQFLL